MNARNAAGMPPVPLLPAAALWRMAGALLAGALAILWLGGCTDVDLALADAVFDARAGVFPWRHAWLTERVGHGVLKWAMALVALGFVAAAARDLAVPRLATALGRLRLRIVALSALLVPAVVSALKQFSASHCPWDLARYGGSEPYLRLFEVLPSGAAPGQCLPAGHASSALWLVSLAVYWLPARPARAGAVAVAALVPGALLGGVQQLRGAHFLSHTLWSAWIACAIVLAIVAALQPGPRIDTTCSTGSEPSHAATADQ